MASIVAVAVLAVVVAAPLWTARAVLGVILAWLVRHSDGAGAMAQAPASSAAARSILANAASSNDGISSQNRVAHIHPVAVLREG
jgi:hypothetical protein